MSDATEVLNALNARLSKRYRKNAPVLFMGSELPTVEWVPTGLLGYDYVNGGGGPRGHVEMIYGAKSSGKTSVCLKRVAQAQRLGLKCAWIEVEHTLDPNWAAKIGVNLDDLLVYLPDNEPAETILGVVEEMIRSEELDLIIVDSIAALSNAEEMNSSLEDKHYAGISGLMTQFYRRNVCSGAIYNSNCILVFINQPRDLIGSRIPNLKRTPGGNALAHMCSIITEVKQGDYLTVGTKENEIKVGVEVRLINKKNKVRWPFRESTLRLQFANGFNPLWEVVHFGRKYELIEFNGAWGYYKGQAMGQGENQIMEWLADNADAYIELRDEIIEEVRRGRA